LEPSPPPILKNITSIVFGWQISDEYVNRPEIRQCYIKGSPVPLSNHWKENGSYSLITPMGRIEGPDEPHIVQLIRTQLQCLKKVSLASLDSSMEAPTKYFAQTYVCRMLAAGHFNSVQLLSYFERYTTRCTDLDWRLNSYPELSVRPGSETPRATLYTTKIDVLEGMETGAGVSQYGEATSRAISDKRNLPWGPNGVLTVFIVRHRDIEQDIEDANQRKLHIDQALGMSQKERDREIKLLETRLASFREASWTREDL
jgi:hypothetical protein